jgi:hypothetical protein
MVAEKKERVLPGRGNQLDIGGIRGGAQHGAAGHHGRSGT